MGAFSPPLRLTGRLLELWASHPGWTDDELLSRARTAEVIPLRAGESSTAPGDADAAAEETPPRRAAAQRDAR